MAVQKSSNAVCFQDERKKEDPLSTEVQRQCESKMIPTELPMFSTDFAAQNLYTALAWHKSPHWPTSLFHEISLPTQMLYLSLKTNTLLLSQGMEYDHEGQKTSKRNLEKDYLIICHSVEEGEENKKTKLFFLFLCT